MLRVEYSVLDVEYRYGLSQVKPFSIFVGDEKTTSQFTAPHPMKRTSRWYTVVTLSYDLCYWQRNFF